MVTAEGGKKPIAKSQQPNNPSAFAKPNLITIITLVANGFTYKSLTLLPYWVV